MQVFAQVSGHWKMQRMRYRLATAMVINDTCMRMVLPLLPGSNLSAKSVQLEPSYPPDSVAIISTSPVGLMRYMRASMVSDIRRPPPSEPNHVGPSVHRKPDATSSTFWCTSDDTPGPSKRTAVASHGAQRPPPGNRVPRASGANGLRCGRDSSLNRLMVNSTERGSSCCPYLLAQRMMFSTVVILVLYVHALVNTALHDSHGGFSPKLQLEGLQWVQWVQLCKICIVCQ